uniref:PfkB domain-containing protein n=1 Tax=Globodera pallida TaxID=36090 RepID=A0A183BKR9_GLOPA
MRQTVPKWLFNWADRIRHFSLVPFPTEMHCLRSWKTMRECASQFHDKFGAHHSIVICPWGEKSPDLRTIENLIGPGRVVDTLAAGDCFIAGTVHFLNAGNGLLKALKKATFLACESVGQRGLWD